MIQRTALLLPVLALLGCSSAEPDETPPSEYTVFFNGSILTMDGERPSYAEAVVVKGDRIVFVGDRSVWLEDYPDALPRNLDGKAMLPGFIDAHSHFMFALNMVNQANVASPPVGPCTDVATTIEALQAYQAEAQVPSDGWIVGWGYDSDGLAEGRHITKLDLDEYFPDHKVVLIHVSAHGAVLNSAALAFVGIDATTEDPVGGVIARLPDSNEPAGLLMETAYLPIFERIPQPSQDELLELMGPAQQMYASQGYTHAYEGATHLADLHLLMKAANQGRIYLDLSCLPLFLEADRWMSDPRYPFGDYKRHLKLQGIKFVQDGSPQGRTAYVSAPYLTGGPDGQPDWRGEPTQPAEDFIDQVVNAIDAGLQVFIHANGDAAIDDVLAALRKAGIRAEDDRRPVVIHSQIQRPDHLDAYVELGVTPSYFTNHCFFWGDTHIRNLGLERAAFISPLNSAIEKGVVCSNHSDFNVTPLDPLLILWTAMSRTTRRGVVLGPDERVDAYTALQGLTTGPAYQLFEEDRKGAIKEGLLADFVILSGDPTVAGPERVRELRVLETIKEGVTVYSAD